TLNSRNGTLIGMLCRKGWTGNSQQTMPESNSNICILLSLFRLYRLLVIDRLYCIFEKQGFGHLVAITSVGGLRGEPSAPAYSATKAYQINYMEAIRKKAFKNGGRITVTDIRPGLVNTAMAKGEDLFWVMPVEKVSNQIISAIRKKRSKVYVTKQWHILAFIYKILPFSIIKRL
ncbi:MAG: SDR family NAD(P)-dependent oxidoreductase, partial [Prevotella sp.]|nr:SDR family NAD(P)-dependent oxidoreductase [Prevotella sp.]